jgi:hypothetical protein
MLCLPCFGQILETRYRVLLCAVLDEVLETVCDQQALLCGLS